MKISFKLKEKIRMANPDFYKIFQFENEGITLEFLKNNRQKLFNHLFKGTNQI